MTLAWIECPGEFNETRIRAFRCSVAVGHNRTVRRGAAGARSSCIPLSLQPVKSASLAPALVQQQGIRRPLVARSLGLSESRSTWYTITVATNPWKTVQNRSISWDSVPPPAYAVNSVSCLFESTLGSRPGGIRTPDQGIMSPLLSPLSYGPRPCPGGRCIATGRSGTTRRTTARHGRGLAYTRWFGQTRQGPARGTVTPVDTTIRRPLLVDLLPARAYLAAAHSVLVAAVKASYCEAQLFHVRRPGVHPEPIGQPVRLAGFVGASVHARPADAQRSVVPGQPGRRVVWMLRMHEYRAPATLRCRRRSASSGRPIPAASRIDPPSSCRRVP